MSRKVGMRIVKSCIAAYLCFVVYMLRGQKGIPFYSVIASIFCMQPLLSRSLKVAGERMKGTIIGVAVGIFIYVWNGSFIWTSICGSIICCWR